MAGLAHTLTHGADALALRLEQYKNLPLFSALITTFTNQVQEAEDALYSILGVSLNQGHGQNLLPLSEDFRLTGSGWQGAGVLFSSTVTGPVPAPDGTYTAWTVGNLAGHTNGGILYWLGPDIPYGDYTFSIWVRSVSGTEAIHLQVMPTDGTSAAFTATPTWQRFSVSGTRGPSSPLSPGGALVELSVDTTGHTVQAFGASLVPQRGAGIYERTAGAPVFGQLIGAQLDLIGRIVGQARQGFADDVYVLFLRGRIAVNKSHGRLEDFLTIVKLLSAPGQVCHVTEQYPGKLTINLTIQPTTLVSNALNQLLQQARAGGVSINLVATPVDGFSFLLAGGGAGPGVGFPNADHSPGSGGKFVG